MRDGVSPSTLALPAGAWPSISHYFAHRLPLVSHAGWVERMRRGDVVDASGRPVPPEAPYVPHTRLHYYRSLPPETRIPFEEHIVYQDARIVVADKPHFLPITPKGRYLQETLLVRLKRRLGIATLVPAHRIDRETAGLVLFTVDPSVRDAYQALFRDRALAKTYEAIAPWRDDLPADWVYRCRLVPGEHFLQMRVAGPNEGPPNAETRIERLETRGPWARYRLSPVTGLKHQLRVQMASLGLPLQNDRIYPVLQPDAAPGALPDLGRPLQLLARSLAFTDPVTGEARVFHSQQALVLPG